MPRIARVISADAEWVSGFRWLHELFGTNMRLTEMQSAIGRVQLRKLPEWTRIRNRHAAILTDGFSKIPSLRLTIPPPEIGHAYYKYYVFIRPEMIITSSLISCFSRSDNGCGGGESLYGNVEFWIWPRWAWINFGLENWKAMLNVEFLNFGFWILKSLHNSTQGYNRNCWSRGEHTEVHGKNHKIWKIMDILHIQF